MLSSATSTLSVVEAIYDFVVQFEVDWCLHCQAYHYLHSRMYHVYSAAIASYTWVDSR